MKTSQIDRDLLLNIFNSSQDIRRSDAIYGLDDLITRINANEIIYSLQIISTGSIFTKFYRLCYDNVETTPEVINVAVPELDNLVFKAGGGSFHQQLILMGAAFLLDQNIEPLIETYYHGKLVDIIALDKSWIIECGDTSPQPVVDHLSLSYTRFGVIPFQVLTPEPRMTIHVFSR